MCVKVGDGFFIFFVSTIDGTGVRDGMFLCVINYSNYIKKVVDGYSKIFYGKYKT